jgi:hypothetical protein
MKRPCPVRLFRLSLNNPMKYIDTLKNLQRKKLTKVFSLKEQVQVDCPGGFFVKALPTTESAVLLASYFRVLDPLQIDLHATVLYTKQTAVDVILPKIDKHSRYSAIGKELLYWESNDGNIVLKLDSPDLVALHQQFKDAGLVPSFPEYIPHVTLIHPCEYNHYQHLMNDLSSRLSSAPLSLEFYYGGYTIMETT